METKVPDLQNLETERQEDAVEVNGDEDDESSADSDDDDDERYNLTVEQKRNLKIKKDTYKAMRDVFRTLDVDGSGSLEITELETAIKSMGVEYSEKDMANLVKQMDSDGNGSVDFFEFCGMISEKMKVYDPEKELREAFAVFDINGDGRISEEEIQTVVESLGGKMSKEELDSMLREADDNSDGYLDYEEFVKIWMGETSGEKNANSAESTEGNGKTECSVNDKPKPDLITVPE